MVRSAVRVFILSAWSVLVNSQYVPPSPCPNVFTYKSDGRHTYGLIRYQPPGQLKHVFIRADFVIGAQLPPDYAGELEVQGSKASILLRMLRGQSLEYRVDFPLADPLPTLAAITVNSLVICSGQSETASPSESYSLEHLLFDKGDGDLSLLVVGKTATNRPTPSPVANPLSAEANEMQCGVVSGGNRQVELVYLGEAVAPGKWPWLVAIYAKTRNGIKYICAGSLVSDQHVITAAHSMSRLGVVKAKEDFVLKLGAFNLYNTNDPQVVTRGVINCNVAAAHCMSRLGVVKAKEDFVLKLGAFDLDNTNDLQVVTRGVMICIVAAAHCMSRLGVVKAKEDFVLKLGAFNLDNTNDPQVVTRGVINCNVAAAHCMSRLGVVKAKEDFVLKLGAFDLDNTNDLQVVTRGVMICIVGAAHCMSRLGVVKAKEDFVLKLGAFNLDNTNDTQVVTRGVINCNVAAAHCMSRLGVVKAKEDFVLKLGAFDLDNTNDLQVVTRGVMICIVAAAHCMSRLGIVKAKEDFVLKLGAFDLDNTNDPQVVTRGVKSAAMHFFYDSHTLANDLLILFLDSPVIFTTYIKPVCLWEGATDLNSIINKYGTVVGWGGNELRESGTGEPRMASLPIVSTETCRSTRKEFHDLTSRTTICVGNRNGTGPCNGDSGGGLYMLSGGLWRLRGLVSVSLRPATGEAKCNLDEYVVLTDVAQYLTWVRQHLAGIAAPSLMPLPVSGPTVPKPVSHSDAAGAAGCGVVAGGNERVPLLYSGYFVSHGDWPWLAAVYLQIRGYKIAYICTGSLISDQHVITAGQCYSEHQLIVKLGAFDLGSSNEPSRVGIKVMKASPHDLYDRATNINNILILTLEKTVQFTTYIRPVCLWEKESDPVIVGETGMVVGWGRNGINIVAIAIELAKPAAASFPVVSTETCVKSLPEIQRYAYNNTFCAGYTNGTRLCNGDSGGGLYMMSGGRWRLRGISYDLLALITVDDNCSLQEYALFTDVTEYLPWIRKHANLEVQDNKDAPEEPFLPTIEF